MASIFLFVFVRGVLGLLSEFRNLSALDLKSLAVLLKVSPIARIGIRKDFLPPPGQTGRTGRREGKGAASVV